LWKNKTKSFSTSFDSNLQTSSKPFEIPLKIIKTQLFPLKTFITNGEEGEEEEASELHPPPVHQKVSKTSSDSFIPNYNRTYHPAMPIASITARSIPSQIRADLK
jgi:hypothetical protein